MMLTKDERVLLKLHELTENSDIKEIDRFVLGRAAGLNDHAVNIIVRDLAQVNFIKKGDGNSVYLTPHGQKLVNLLLEQLNNK